MNIYFADDRRFRNARRRATFHRFRRPAVLFAMFAAAIAWLSR